MSITKEAGADEFINYSTNDLNLEVKKLTGGAGADVIYDVVGGDIFNKVSYLLFLHLLRKNSWKLFCSVLGVLMERVDC